jgi:hypothetical protein
MLNPSFSHLRLETPSTFERWPFVPCLRPIQQNRIVLVHPLAQLAWNSAAPNFRRWGPRSRAVESVYWTSRVSSVILPMKDFRHSCLRLKVSQLVSLCCWFAGDLFGHLLDSSFGARKPRPPDRLHFTLAGLFFSSSWFPAPLLWSCINYNYP